jgi:hypothetical protein
MHHIPPNFLQPPTGIDLFQTHFLKYRPFPKLVLSPQVKKRYVQHIVRADRYRGPHPARYIMGNVKYFFTYIAAAAQLGRWTYFRRKGLLFIVYCL